MQNWIFTLVINTLVTTLLIMILSGLTLILKSKLAPGVRYFLWVAILFSLLVPVRPIFGQGVVKISSPSFEGGGGAGSSSPVLESPSTYGFWASINNFPWTQLILAIWLVIAILFFVRQLYAYWNLKQMIKRWGRPITDSSYLRALKETRQLLACKEEVQLIHYPLVKSPMMTGFLHPILLLPELDYEEEELQLIFEHELTHLKHKDLYANLLSVIVTSLYWFNPAVHFAAREMQEAAELYCDFSVLKRHGEEYRFYYVETILTMIDRGRKRPSLLTTCFYSNKMNLKRRIQSIMDNTSPGKIVSTLLLLGTGLSLVFSGSIFVYASQTPIVWELQAKDPQHKALLLVLKMLGILESEIREVVVSEVGKYYQVDFMYKGDKYTALVQKSDLVVLKIEHLSATSSKRTILYDKATASRLGETKSNRELTTSEREGTTVERENTTPTTTVVEAGQTPSSDTPAGSDSTQTPVAPESDSSAVPAPSPSPAPAPSSAPGADDFDDDLAADDD